MARFITILSIFMFFGCEMNSKQIIIPEKFDYKIIKFDAVSKKLMNEFNANADQKLMSEIILYWFDNKIKTDGFNGDLAVVVKSIDINKVKVSDYYKFSISLSIDFIIQNSKQKQKKFQINSSDYGEIKGSFSIKDQENLDLNIMHQALENISLKAKELN